MVGPSDTRSTHSPPARRVVIVAFPDVQILDVTGPAEVFALANRLNDAAAYSIELVAPKRGPLRTSGGIGLLAERSLAACRGPIDTLVVAGGAGVTHAEEDARVTSWLRSAAGRSRRVASVCSGAFLLARAGLLDARRATTQWAACETLARRYPSVTVELEPIFVRDGNVYTSAGVTAGIDLALALVEEDLGDRVALELARSLVLFVRRPGGQAQFSSTLAGQRAEHGSLRELQDWIVDHLDLDLSVPALARRAFMSPRNFARVFRREIGVTPAVYVESLRVERARLLLESSEHGIGEIARQCGFGTVETLRRGFARALGVSPGEYRRRFQPATAIASPAAGPTDAHTPRAHSPRAPARVIPITSRRLAG
jgi:transcriptional regulator GlxA family with amidase domain